ncbi:glycosyltransferase family 2 protein [Parasulfitobacter algicola]|uniref:Glycosyltransferase family 2 protein n=1 Tax=Parasulfitobacter algicola TaxID=2614809 RepID=A0ABX2IVS2_9RHOB|nr:glycosyltransferase family 2 protein [Sulfitobacter algicola]NSX56390.1 glycosyltransferase family 2 protein [Sulfitobacter algicola]
MGILKDIWRGKTAWQMGLKVKLWRATTPLDPPSDQPVVIFAVNLVSRRRAPDWDETCANLAQTVASFRAQTCDQWRAIICGQDKPKGIDFDNQVQFLKSYTSDKFNDQGDKRRQIISHVARTVKTDGYYMRFDADDILHPKAVEHMCRDNNGAGYFVETGYMYDVSNDNFAPLGPRYPDIGIVPFYALCGSCCAVRYDFRTSRKFRHLLNEMKAHGRIIDRMQLYGFQMAPFPFPAALYLVNHGQNMVERRGKMDGKVSYVQQHLIKDKERTDQIRSEFKI